MARRSTRGLLLSAIGLLAALAPAAGGGDTGQDLELDGVIEPYVVVELGAAVDGLLERLEVDRGDRVEAGQVLAELESSVERATMELARARAEGTAELDSATAQLELATRRLDRMEQLYREDVISEGQVDEARTEKRLAELALRRAREAHEVARLEYSRARAALELRTVRSPVSGVVIERYLAPGELVYRANQAPILRIAQVDPLRVEVIARAGLLGSVAVGDRARVYPDELDLGPLEARVEVVDRVVDAASGTFGVRLLLENGDGAVPAGLTCRVRFLR